MNKIVIHINPNRDGDLKERAEATAKAAKMSLSGWCRWVISTASDRQLAQGKAKP